MTDFLVPWYYIPIGFVVGGVVVFFLCALAMYLAEKAGDPIMRRFR